MPDSLNVEPACGQCAGLGYLLGQSYERAELPAGWLPVQRCDACLVFDGDAAAAVEAAQGRPVRLFSALDADGHELGDWAVQS